MTTPHKHAALIKQWADNPALKFELNGPMTAGKWVDTDNPMWSTEYDYRIKPTPKPDIVSDELILLTGNARAFIGGNRMCQNVRFTFDGETQDLKSVELIKCVVE